MAKRKHPLPRLFIEYEVRDKDGRLLKKGRKESQTWVGNLVALLRAIIATYVTGSGNYYGILTPADLVDTSNTARPVALAGFSTGIYLGGRAPEGDTSAGILVGTSDTPVALDQFNLINLIAHGSSSGQLYYGATNVEAITKGASWFFRVVRTFTNNSGGTITVREVGLFVKLGYNVSPGYYTCILARDVIPGGISIPNGSTLTFRYVITHSLS